MPANSLKIPFLMSNENDRIIFLMSIRAADDKTGNNGEQVDTPPEVECITSAAVTRLRRSMLLCPRVRDRC